MDNVEKPVNVFDQNNDVPYTPIEREVLPLMLLSTCSRDSVRTGKPVTYTVASLQKNICCANGVDLQSARSTRKMTGVEKFDKERE